MKILRIILLTLLLWNIPSVANVFLGSTLGSLLSYATAVLCAVYYFFEKKTAPNWWIIIIALLYFTISSFQYIGETKYFINETIKFFVFVLGGYALIKKVNSEQLFLFILIGSLSIAVDMFFFSTDKARYSGFYLNPNVAGFICIYGYALTYSLKNSSLKSFGQFILTLMGLLTFSRTFIVIWLFLNLISLKISIKNIRILGIGFLIISTLLVVDGMVGFHNPRFAQLKNFLNKEEVSKEALTEDSRTDTWALYYDKIYESPIFGNGYGSFAGEVGKTAGVHNSYLRVMGEAGIVPFVLFVVYIMYLLYWSIIFFKIKPYLLMQTIALTLFLLANHNFFAFYYLTFAAMWIQYQIVKQKELFDNTKNQLDTDIL